MDKDIVSALDDLLPRLSELFERIGAETGSSHGITRDAYGERETAAGDMLAEFAREHGLEANYDPVGNLNITAAGCQDEAPELLIGSHIDSVPRGGNFDGLAGVVAGLGTLVALDRLGRESRRGLRVLGFRGEESPWFGTAYLGSKLFTGQMSPSEARSLTRFDTGRSLADHLADLGVDAGRIGSGPVVPLDRVRAYLELHIEQGPALEACGRAAGIATAIRGNIRHPFARCHGRYAHSAAVPRHLRSDALVATAKLVAHGDALWAEEIAAGHDDAVFTCGILQTDAAEHSMTKVPGEVSFTLNVGGTDDEVMERLNAGLVRKADALAVEHRVGFDLGTRVGTAAVQLDPRIADALARSATALGEPPFRMPTVGHDAAMFARIGIATGMVLVRNANGSHNPDEAMTMADFAVGLRMLALGVEDIVAGA